MDKTFEEESYTMARRQYAKFSDYALGRHIDKYPAHSIWGRAARAEEGHRVYLDPMDLDIHDQFHAGGLRSDPDCTYCKTGQFDYAV